MSPPVASVVVPTFRRPELLRRCLDALLDQDLHPGLFEIIVVDDDPERSAAEVVEQVGDGRRNDCPALRYFALQAHAGPAAARNLGWCEARGEVIAFTDDDCVPTPGWLAAGLDVLSEEGIDGAAGRIVVPRPRRPTDYEATTARLEVSAFATASCFYRRSALESVGGFNETFSTAWREDTDLRFRLLQRGAHLTHAELAVVVHPVRAAPWGISLREQRKSMFNALCYKTDPARYRRYVQQRPPIKYYATLAAATGVAGFTLAGNRRAASVSAAAWALLTLEFAGRRLRHTSRRPGHVLEMLLTSALIPPLSIFWRLRGAVRYRVLFL